MKSVEWAAYHLRMALRRLNDALQVAVLEEPSKVKELTEDRTAIGKVLSHLGNYPKDWEPLDFASVTAVLNELLDWADDVFKWSEEEVVMARILIVAYNLLRREPSEETKVELEKHFISEGGEFPWWIER